MYGVIAKKNMAKILISKNTVIGLSSYDIFPRMIGKLQVKYSGKVYEVKEYLCNPEKLILRDPQQPDCEFIVKMEKVKPLLRRMDSMTDEEKERYQELLDGINQTTGVWKVAEWLNYKLFDYEKLIDKGLAEEM